MNPWGELQLVEVGPELARRGFHVLSIAPPIVGEPDAYLPTRLAQYAVSIADERAMHGVAAEPPSATWERIRVPVLLLVSSENTRDLDPFRRALPEARIEIVDSGHDVVEDAPDRVVALVAPPDG